jgi:hypothetical protein
MTKAIDNLKSVLIGAGIIAVLAIIAMIALAFQNKNTAPAEDSRGFYIIEHPEIGFRFKASDEFFVGFQEYQTGYTFSYDLPTKDPEWNKFSKYANVLNIVAVPRAEAEAKRNICEQNLTNQMDSPFDCLIFDNPIGQNKYFYFTTIPLIEAGPEDLQARGVYEEIADMVQNIEFFDPPQAPTHLKFKSAETGIELKYPANLDRALFDRAKFEELGASITLPRELNSGDLFHFAEKELFRIIPVQYCSLSGECRNSTTNFVINFGPTGYGDTKFTLQDFYKSEIGSSLNKRLIGNHTVYIYEIGAEGEGIIYYFVLAPKDNIYVVALKYINEQVMLNYKNAKGFVPFADQMRTAEDIIKSLTFQIPLREF